MIQSINPSADSFLADVDQLQAKLQRAAEQISSGLRVTKPSDDPNVVSDILEISSNLARNDQTGKNLAVVKAEVDGAEQALQNANSTLDQISTIAAQGANFDQTANTRAGLASDVQSLLQQLIGDANTSVENRFVFAGDADGTSPYALDLTTNTGTTPYAGSPATRQVEDPRGGAFPVSQTAQQIFDAPGASVFQAVNGLRVALLANDQAGVTASIAALKTAQNHLNDSLSFYGSVQNEVAEATAAGKTIGLELKSNLSALRDTDVVAATSELSQVQFNLQAAFEARAKFPPTSLFNFLG